MPPWQKWPTEDDSVWGQTLGLKNVPHPCLITWGNKDIGKVKWRLIRGMHGCR